MSCIDRRESLFPSYPWPTRCLFSIFTFVQTLLRHRRTFHETKISTRFIAGEQSQFVWLSDRYSSTHLVQIPHGHVRNIFRLPHLLYRVLSRRKGTRRFHGLVLSPCGIVGSCWFCTSRQPLEQARIESDRYSSNAKIKTKEATHVGRRGSPTRFKWVVYPSWSAASPA